MYIIIGHNPIINVIKNKILDKANNSIAFDLSIIEGIKSEL